MPSRDVGAVETAGLLVEDPKPMLCRSMLWSIGGIGRGAAPEKGARTGSKDGKGETPGVDGGLARGVARGVVEPELLLSPELLLLSDLLLSSAFFLPLELLGVLGVDILAGCMRRN